MRPIFPKKCVAESKKWSIQLSGETIHCSEKLLSPSNCSAKACFGESFGEGFGDFLTPQFDGRIVACFAFAKAGFGAPFRWAQQLSQSATGSKTGSGIKPFSSAFDFFNVGAMANRRAANVGEGQTGIQSLDQFVHVAAGGN